jgi:hypothetical protein
MSFSTRSRSRRHLTRPSALSGVDAFGYGDPGLVSAEMVLVRTGQVAVAIGGVRARRNVIITGRSDAVTACAEFAPRAR